MCEISWWTLIDFNFIFNSNFGGSQRILITLGIHNINIESAAEKKTFIGFASIHVATYHFQTRFLELSALLCA